jgi:queuine tRNA-ribosyltransferase
MPVGTKAAVKTLSPDQLKDLGVQMILCNSYHLALRPGEKIVSQMGGLRRFMNWPGPILTDSGGYQVFSLARLLKLNDEGVEFRSHLDGDLFHLTPERAVDIQVDLGSTIAMPLDEPVAYPCPFEVAERAMNRTHAWLRRCVAQAKDRILLFGIVQGSTYPALRRASAEQLVAEDLPGYAIGGLAMKEPPELMYELAALSTSLLPPEKPRYLMGVGTPRDLVRCIAEGVDLFDCVLPTRLGRTGWAFTDRGVLRLRHERFREDPQPIDPACECPACRSYSRAYLRHCITTDEILGLVLVSTHNLYYYMALIRAIRKRIIEGTLGSWLLKMNPRWGSLQPTYE